MISVVVCSAKQNLFDSFAESVSSTIGVPFEIIRIDNSRHTYSICAAYNEGKTKCKYDIICFSHEDVIFETINWGRIIIHILADPTIGLAGVLGACYVSLFPADWIDPKECEGQFRAGFKDGKPVITFRRFASKDTAEVAVADGFFMAVRAEVLRHVRFSEDLLPGFHGYDFDICSQVRERGLKIVVSRNILLTHASRGNFNASYYQAVDALRKKWRRRLPVHIPAYSPIELNDLAKKALLIHIQDKRSKDVIRHYVQTIGYAIKNRLLVYAVKRLWFGRKAQPGGSIH